MPLTPNYTERRDIEAAIALLQKHGYTVFNSAAHRSLMVTCVQDAALVARYSDDRGFMESVRREQARKISEAMLDGGHFQFRREDPREEDIKNYGLRYETRMTTRFKFFSNKDKEWQR